MQAVALVLALKEERAAAAVVGLGAGVSRQGVERYHRSTAASDVSRLATTSTVPVFAGSQRSTDRRRDCFPLFAFLQDFRSGC